MTDLKNHQLIVVLGMHRSGTSALTRGLVALDVELGADLIPPEEANRKGFWEDIELSALNIEILNTLHSHWHHLAMIEQDALSLLHKHGYYQRALDLLRQKVSAAPVFAFKDPRTAKLMPFWKEVFNACQFDVSYILAVRHPLSVAKSLAKRDRFDAEKSYLLWQVHILNSLIHTTGHKRVLVDYDLLMASPEHTLTQIAQQLDLTINAPALQNYQTTFIDPSLRHTVYNLDDLSVATACPPLVRDMYPLLVDIAAGREQLDAPAMQAHIMRWANESARINSTLKLVDRITDRLSKRDAQLTQLLASRSWRLTRPLRVIKAQLKKSPLIMALRRLL